MSIGVLEYQASIKLESKANDLRSNTGANQFYSLLGALYRIAGSEEVDKLNIAFPGVFEELEKRYNAPAGLLYPGERVVIGDYLIVMDPDGKVLSTAIKDEQ
jgi:hypothetical protein